MRFPALIVAVLLLAACAPRIEVRGNLPDTDLLADIEIGRANRDDVQDLLGSPSAVATFDQETWYYISQQTQTFAFFEPEVTERKVVVIRFDKKGVVTALRTVGLEAGRDIQIVERKTPTAGNEITILQQIFGNIGRFEGGPQ